MLQANEASHVSRLPQPECESESDQVREQLERLLAHPLFHQSKRYPALLRYAVEQTLLGYGDQIKERNIGIEVFGRDPNYDTNADPIVRSTASEVRKRLAQYYVDPSHSGELQIDLPSGSYIAVFHNSAHDPGCIKSKDELADAAEPGQSVSDSLATQSTPEAGVSPRRGWKLAAWFVLCGILMGSAGFCSGYWLLAHRTASAQSQMRSKAMDQFWSLIANAPGIATLCIGESSPQSGDDADHIVIADNDTQSQGKQLHVSESLATADLITLTHLAAELGMRGKPYRISRASQTNFSQLHEGPVVLIGTFENPWILRFTQNLRFNYLAKDGIASIVDRRGTAQTRWSRSLNLPNQRVYVDYSLIARFRDSATNLPIVLVAGIDPEGAEASGTILSNASDLDKLLQQAPRNWAAMNMEAVIETQVVDGFPGPPKILAVEFW